MKIAMVTLSLDPERGGGTAERTRRLAFHLTSLGCACSVVTLAGTTWLSELKTAGIKIYVTGHVGRRYPLPLARPITLLRVVREADVVLVMGYWYVLAALVCLVARIAGRPVALCPAGELSPFGCKTLLKKIFYWFCGRKMIATAASIIATNVRERDEIVGNFGIAPSRVTISPNGIALSTLDENCSVALPAIPFILFLGRLTAIKGPDLLVEAFAQVSKAIPNVSLVIAGPDFGMRGALEARVRALGIDRHVHFLGFVDERTRQQLYRKAALLAVPSRSEVMSMVALEAGVMGLPVLLTDRCGFEEIEDVGGGLVVSANERGLAEGLTKMLVDIAALPLMGERLRQFVLTRYAWGTVACQLREHLANLAKVSSQQKLSAAASGSVCE
jgi:glycosyltransferase involved in cell wall biosynthesis